MRRETEELNNLASGEMVKMYRKAPDIPQILLFSSKPAMGAGCNLFKSEGKKKLNEFRIVDMVVAGGLEPATSCM